MYRLLLFIYFLPIPLFAQEVYPVIEYGKWNFMDVEGKIIYHGEFNKVTEFNSNKAAVYDELEGWQYLNYNLIDGEYYFDISDQRYLYANAFSEGYAFVRKLNGEWCFIDIKEKRRIKLHVYHQYVSKFKNGRYCTGNYTTKCFDMAGHIVFKEEMEYETPSIKSFEGDIIYTINGNLYDVFGFSVPYEKAYRLTGDAWYYLSDSRVKRNDFYLQLIDKESDSVLLDSCYSIHFASDEDSICILRTKNKSCFYNYNQKKIIADSLSFTVPYFESTLNGYNHTLGFGKKQLAAVMRNEKFVYINRKGEIIWEERKKQ